MKKRLAILVALVGLAAISFAQQDRQPRGKAETMVHGKKVAIDYGRPALKGRSLDALMEGLPEDRIWRAGENQVTILETATDLKIGGKAIPAGKYSLYVYAPAEGNWALCVNKNLGIELGKIYAQAPPEMAKEMWPRLDGYEKNIAGDEVARIPMMKGSAPASDVFTIGLSANELTMVWGAQSWKTGLE
jgi:hypothetical protein